MLNPDPSTRALKKPKLSRKSVTIYVPADLYDWLRDRYNISALVEGAMENVVRSLGVDLESINPAYATRVPAPPDAAILLNEVAAHFNIAANLPKDPIILGDQITETLGTGAKATIQRDKGYSGYEGTFLYNREIVQGYWDGSGRILSPERFVGNPLFNLAPRTPEP